MSFNSDKTALESLLNKAGWDIGDFHAPLLDSHFVYVCDYRNGETKLFSILKTDMQESYTHTLIPVGVLAGFVAELTLKTVGKPLSGKDSSSLSAALLGYIKSTQTYRIWAQVSGKDARMHCLLNIYPAPDGGELMRPVMIKSKSTVADVEQVQSASAELLRIDTKNNPEWFAKKRKKREGRV